MITGIILLVLAILFFYLGNLLHERYDYIGTSIVLVTFGVTFSVWFVFHVIGISMKSYSYNRLVVMRESFVTSLEESRESGRELESASILREVVQFNQRLASQKYNNKIWFLGQYIDDRIENLEPIR
jgi:hypothetical protein